jgi:uncharacterized membrane protein YgcG
MMRCSHSRAAGAVLMSTAVGLLVLAAAPAASHAEQFVLFDVTFTYTKMNADTSTPSRSHYYVRGPMLNAQRPRDWTSPIDYRNGTVHVRAEILDKPAGGANTRWTLCYIPNQGTDNGYGCTNTAAYTEKGIYDVDIGMTTWWENESIVWTQGIKQMDLVMKDAMGRFAHTLPAEQYFPTTVRITMIQVSKGATYDPTQVPNLPPSMAGDAGVQPEGGADAGAEVGSGSGGAGGGGAVTGSGGNAGGGSGGAPGTSGSGGTTTAGSGGSSSGGTSGGAAGGPGSGAVTAGGCAFGETPRGAGWAGLLLIGSALIVARRRRR